MTPAGSANIAKLKAELEQEGARLPTHTLISLVTGGLKVRMIRSAVTMFSVILAIAYLTYSGLINSLCLNLAKQNDNQINLLLRRAGVNITDTLEGSILDKWLASMALLTCAVGIANAMLMSVTERFREIGTMKCLGAEDSLIVRMFLLESAFLGVAGGVCGIVLGSVVTIVGGLIQFGAYTIRFFPVAPAVGWILGSVLAGVVLSLAGAGYPAYVAARMRPVEALRVEE